MPDKESSRPFSASDLSVVRFTRTKGNTDTVGDSRRMLSIRAVVILVIMQFTWLLSNPSMDIASVKITTDTAVLSPNIMRATFYGCLSWWKAIAAYSLQWPRT